MKKAIVIGLILATMSMTACNKQVVDFNYKFDKAIIDIGNDIITIDIKSWTDFDDGDQIQITDTNGKTYLVHSSKCTLVKE